MSVCYLKPKMLFTVPIVVTHFVTVFITWYLHCEIHKPHNGNKECQSGIEMTHSDHCIYDLVITL